MRGLYQRHDQSGRLITFSLIPTFRYFHPLKKRVELYGGGGAGFSAMEFKGEDKTTTWKNTWNAKLNLGISYRVDPNLDLGFNVDIIFQSQAGAQVCDSGKCKSYDVKMNNVVQPTFSLIYHF